MAPPKGHLPYPGCETGGRPPKYTEEFINNEADELIKWMQDDKNIFLEKFAYERGYYDELFHQWAKVNDKFSIAFKMFKNKQKYMLMMGGLNKKYNYNMAALILGHAHGVVAKTEQKLSGDGVNPLECIIGITSGKTKDLNVKENEEAKN